MRTPVLPTAYDHRVFERSATLYDLVYGFKDYAGEAARVETIVRERRTTAHSLLDVACGTGRHLEHLRRWFDVAGIDLDPGLLAVARERLPGVPLHEADMRSFDLGRIFDAVICLFSAIGYVGTVAGLDAAVAAMARHLAPRGVLVLEPWLTPDAWHDRHVALLTAEEPELKVARATVARRDGRLSIMDFHYLVATPDGVEAFQERHEAGLFTDVEYRSAFAKVGLEVEHDPEGLIGRGLYIGLGS